MMYRLAGFLAGMLLCGVRLALADTFGTGANRFNIDFVTISGDASAANGTNISRFDPGHRFHRAFTDPGRDFRMGVYEITNDQWDKFKANLGVPVTGNPSGAYDEDFRDWGSGTTNVPTNAVSWCEAAQFVNWLNTSTGHQAAYKFAGTQGTSDYTFAAWPAAEAAGGTNLYRHKDAFYFLPTEDEWVKAAYWNGSEIQEYATKPSDTLHHGDGTSGTGWNYDDNGGPWEVGSGSEELNGTYDMMGNNWEWTESPWNDPLYRANSSRGTRGGTWYSVSSRLHAFEHESLDPRIESPGFGFRVASVPEPSTLILLGMGVVALLAYAWRKRCRRR